MLTLTKETASEYNFFFLGDASGSMGFPLRKAQPDEDPATIPTRWKSMQESALSLCLELDKIDDDGIDLLFFGGTLTAFENVQAADIPRLFSEVGPRGGTPTAEALQWAINKVRGTGKKGVVFVYTDGEPSDQQAVIRVLTDCANNSVNDDDISFQFVQIGDDEGAAKFLAYLDDNLNAKFDIVDTVSMPEADSMSVIDLINKTIND